MLSVERGSVPARPVIGPRYAPVAASHRKGIVSDKAARIVTVFASAALCAYGIAMWVGALHSQAWNAVPLIYSAWMVWFAWRGYGASEL